jgi:hypothetical protein
LPNDSVGEAIVEQAVDEVAGGFGETGDLAVTGSLFPAVEIGEILEEAGGLAVTSGGESRAVGWWIHRLVD